MKGLDGIQGPIYVGTGCVFRRQAFYGYDAPKKKKSPLRTCNCWPKWCCCGWCLTGTKKKKKTNKQKPALKQKSSHADEAGIVLATFEGTTEGSEGKGHIF